MIQSFSCRETELIFGGNRSRRLPGDIQNVSRRKLQYLDLAKTLNDLRVPPGNQLETLSGDRAGQHSIRINHQWRICFAWSDSGPGQVHVVDYH